MDCFRIFTFADFVLISSLLRRLYKICCGFVLELVVQQNSSQIGVNGVWTQIVAEPETGGRVQCGDLVSSLEFCVPLDNL